MARQVTLLSLRNQVRQRADIENATDRFPDQEVNEYINESIAEMEDILIQSNQDYSLSSTPISVVGGTDTYSLPATFYKVRGVDLSFANYTYALRRWRFEEREMYQGFFTPGQPIAYHIVGNNIQFKPMPGGSYPCVLWFYPSPTRLVSDGDLYDGHAGWEDFIVLDAAIKCLLKDDRDATQLAAQRENIRARVVRMACSQYAGEPDRVRTVRNQRSRWRRAPILPRP